MSNAHPPRRQHTVTKAILKRFIDPKTKRLERYNLGTGVTNPSKPEAVGYVLDFINYDAQHYEDKWQESEGKLSVIYDAFKGGTLHIDPDAITAAKNVIALHAARSRTMMNVLTLARTGERHALISELLGQQGPHLADAFLKRTGFIATGSEALILQAEYEADIATATVTSGQFQGWRIETNFDDLVKLLDRTSIQVVTAAPNARRFMIGDDPSPSMKPYFRGLGPPGGVTWRDAKTIALPMSPDFTIALSDKASIVEVTDKEVEFLNRVQMSNAEESVFYRPDSVLRASADLIRPLKNMSTLQRQIIEYN
jgi:hypothetical protein